MNLLSLAVSASMPLVSVQTDDPMNIIKVLTAELGQKVSKIPKKTITPPLSPGKPPGKAVEIPAFELCKKGSVYVMRNPNMDAYKWSDLYTRMATLECTIIVVNPSDAKPEIFPTGFISCPAALIHEFAQTMVNPADEEYEPLVSALSGLSYQNMIQLSMLAQAHAGVVSAESVRQVRRIFFGTVRGLIQENTEVPFYATNEQLEEWLALDGKLFSEDAPFELRARGLLLDGPPGTGKTMGAKYIARALGLPLYRLDIGSTMGKYVGESEKGLDAALAQADRCAPCVVLLDEIEKVFGGGTGGDSGVSTRALSKLLWWLQEHQSRVLTVMTTNNKKALPPELIREGRIDAQMFFGPLTASDGLTFMRTLANKYKATAAVPEAVLLAAHKIQYPTVKDGDQKQSHAHLTGVVMGLIKKQYLTPATKPATTSKPKKTAK